MSSNSTKTTAATKASSSKQSSTDYEFMSNFSPSLIHKIMLTDPTDFPNLTMNGLPKAKQISFSKFVIQRGFPIVPLAQDSNSSTNDQIDTNNITTNATTNENNAIQQSLSNLSISNEGGNQNNELSMEEQIAQTMHRAYNDMILHQMDQPNTTTTTDKEEEDTNGNNSTSKTTFAPLKSILLEIHNLLRSLIPNRKDLHHSILNDQELINDTILFDTSFDHVCQYIKKVSDALIMLESEYRSETTKEWRDLILNHVMIHWKGEDDMNSANDDKVSIVSNHSNSDNTATTTASTSIVKFTMSPKVFALASTTYLHYKAELCQSETADFQLAHILAPKIHTFGPKYLYRIFCQKFGIENSLADNDNNVDGDVDVETLKEKLPNTKFWIEEMIQNTTSLTREELMSSIEKRGYVISQTGWVDNVLFRSPRNVNDEDINTSATSSTTSTQSSEPPPNSNTTSTTTTSSSSQFLLPEVLWLDMRSVRDIRMTTKMAVVGSVLALHATTAARVNDSVIKQDPLDGPIDECRIQLANAMANNRNIGSQEEYENGICQVVLQLARGSYLYYKYIIC